MRSGPVGRLYGCVLRWALVLAACWPAMAAAEATAYTVASWDMDDGLPHNLIHSIAQGEDGAIWLGTWEGVARFNGHRFSIYDRQNTPGIELSGVFTIARDSAGGMLFGTVDGLYRFHAGHWQSLGGEAIRHQRVGALLRARDGSLWVGTTRTLLHLDRDGRPQPGGLPAGLPAQGVAALLEVDDGVLVGGPAGLYLLPADGGAARRWGEHAGLAAVGSVRELADDGAGGLLIAADSGAWHLQASGELLRLRAGERVDAFARDVRGGYWMAMASGQLVEHDRDGREQVVPVPGVISPALLAGADGVVWAGSSHGLSRVVDGVAHGLTVADGLVSDYVRCVLQDAAGTVWIGHSAGLGRWRGGRVEPVALGVPGAVDPSVLALAPARAGGIWVGTYDRGVMRVDADGKVVQRIAGQGLPSPFVRALQEDADGTLWIGTGAGVASWREGVLTPTGNVRGLPPDPVQVLYRDGDTLWVGTNQGMAALYDDGRVQRWDGGSGALPAQNVFDFLRDADGSLWIASDRGLLRMRDGRFKVYDHASGLPRDKVFRIIDDQHGHLWLSSNQGVFRIERAELDEIDAGTRSQLAVEVVDASDGLPGGQANGASAPAGWLRDDGQLLVPMASGLGVIDPDGIGRRQAGSVPVVIESVQVDGNEQPAASVYRFGALRRLVIDYAGLNYRAPDKVRYRYRLVGFDPDWINAGAGMAAVYTNLAPGRYRFEVQAMSLPLDWRHPEAVGQVARTIEIVPPWWRRPVVIGTLVPSMLLLLGVAYIARVLGSRRQQRRLNAVIEARTRELSEKNQALEAAGREREALLRELEHQAGHDMLTGLPNRRTVDRYLDGVLAETGPLALALLDVDHFKRINDGHGHEVGDAVLQAIATHLAAWTEREGGFAARHGGEEFLLVLPGVGLAGAVARMEALRQALAQLQVPTAGGMVSITVSIGVAARSAALQRRNALVSEADRQLYRAKHAGRDQVCASED